MKKISWLATSFQIIYRQTNFSVNVLIRTEYNCDRLVFMYRLIFYLLLEMLFSLIVLGPNIIVIFLLIKFVFQRKKGRFEWVFIYFSFFAKVLMRTYIKITWNDVFLAWSCQVDQNDPWLCGRRNMCMPNMDMFPPKKQNIDCKI